jgi:hypothetical protein
MKIIKTKRGIIIEAFDGNPATFDSTTFDKVVQPFQENKIRVLESVFLIEDNIEKIITYYFFGRNEPENKERSEKFKTLILTSDWCTFSSKRKLINHIINEKLLLSGARKSDYEKLLQKTMSYRNAFTHGTMSTNGDIVKLKYFEGGPKIKIIDDNYLTEMEKDINLAFDITMEIAYKIGAIVQNDINNNAL